MIGALMRYAERELAAGVHISRITRHILGLYKAEANGRAFRRVLSERACKPGAGLEVIEAALAEIQSPEVALAA